MASNDIQQSTPLTAYTAEHIKEQLRKLNLSVNGNKVQLIRRLQDATREQQNNSIDNGGVNPHDAKIETNGRHTDDEKNTDDENDDESDTEDEENDKEQSARKKKKSDAKSVKRVKSVRKKGKLKHKHVHDDSSSEESSDSSDNDSSSDSDDNDDDHGAHKHRSCHKKSTVSFRDIDDSFVRFSGKDNENIRNWVKDFEDYAKILKWPSLAKLFYGKKLLKGDAKLFVDNELKPKSYKSLKKGLISEFSEKINSAAVHKQLTRRKKQESESYLEYVYDMIKIANQADIDEEAIVVYIADGISDSKRSKTILYECKSIQRLKRKLKIYEMTTHKTDPVRPNDNKKSADAAKSDHSKKSAGKRCFNCGDKEHAQGECPDKAKGPKCFKCNEFGHMSTTCTKPKKPKETPVAAQCKLAMSGKMYKQIQLNGANLCALIDTGSDISIIREDSFRKSGFSHYDESNTIIVGLNSTSNTIGVFNANVNIDNQLFHIKCHVVASNAIAPECIIGMNLLEHADVNISANGVTIKKMQPTTRNYDDNLTSSNDLMQCLYIDEAERKMPSLHHIHDKNIVQSIKKEILDYHPCATKESPVELKIVLNDDKPVYQPPRRLAYSERIIVDSIVNEWTANGIIQSSTSEYASPIVLAKKKDGTHRLCVDYRQLNTKIHRDRYPVPRIDDQIDRLQTVKVFSTIDLKNGFFHVPVEESSRKYTSFVTPSGQYEFLRTPFGLSVSPSAFQRFVNIIFQKLVQDEIVVVYFDDVLVLAKDEDEACDRLKLVFATAAEYGLNINWTKCQFLQRRIEFLGYEIEDGKIWPTETKIHAIMNFPEPKNIHAVQSFLGLTGYLRKFIPLYALLARPLSNLLKKDVKFMFGAQQKASFNQLKQAMTKKPVLAIFKYGAETELHTDASKYALAGILLQRQDDGQMHPVIYSSIKTSEVEQNYHSYELESMAVVEHVKKWRVYLLGQPFKIKTDCKAFAETMKKKEVPKISRWAMIMQEFDCEVIHRSGTSMKHVDALSRVYSYVIRDDSLVKSLQTAQQTDEQLKTIMTIVNEHPHDDYMIQNGLLCKMINGNDVIVVPETMQYDVIRKAHEQGHFKSKKMEEIIKKEFFIPQLSSKMERVIQNCVTCILSERKSGKKECLLNPIPKQAVPLDTIHLDHLGPMASTNKNYKHLLAASDGFSKFNWLFATKTTDANETLTKFKVVTDTFGNPRRVIVDKGGAFTSRIFVDHCASENIELVHTTTGVPRGNGQIERMNRTIISVLTKLSLDNPEKWYLHVNAVQKYMNCTFQRSIKTTPFQLMFGVPMKIKNDLRIRELIDEEVQNEFMNDRDELRMQAKASILKIQEENRKNFNRNRKPAFKYKIGDQVAIKRSQFGSGLKVAAKNLGPYEIIKCKGNDRYDVQKIGNHEGPNQTSCSADNMVKWEFFRQDNSSEADE